VLVSLVSTLILGLLSIRFLPTFHQSVVSVLTEHPLTSLGIGLLATVVTPIACVILFVTVFALPLGLILLAAFFILLYWCRIFAMSWIGDAILRRFRSAPSRTASFLVGLVVYYLLAIVPVIGGIVAPLAVVFGLGAELIVRKEFYATARSREMI
jgi:hypothetical protein